MVIRYANKINNCSDKIKVFISDYLFKMYGMYGDIVITDGLRTMSQHEAIYKRIHGTSYRQFMPLNSAHLKGEAVDFKINAPIHPIKIAKYLLDINNDIGITGIGIPLDKWSFHVDIREPKNRLSIWYYDNRGKIIRG